MNTDNTGENNKAEAPAADVPQSESIEKMADQPEAQPQKSPDDTGKNEVGDVPKENAAWAAQRVANKRLKEENERLKNVVESVDPSYLESLRGATAPQVEQQYQVPSLPEDAEYNQVTQTVNWANQTAANASRQVAQLRQQLELQQDREAERAYPELKTDKAFQQIVAEKKLAARVLGHNRTTLEIADEVSKLLGRREEQITAKVAQETKDQILQRQAISSEPKGHTTGGQSGADREDLRLRVRRGDSKAQEEVAKSIIADLEF